LCAVSTLLCYGLGCVHSGRQRLVWHIPWKTAMVMGWRIAIARQALLHLVVTVMACGSLRRNRVTWQLCRESSGHGSNQSEHPPQRDSAFGFRDVSWMKQLSPSLLREYSDTQSLGSHSLCVLVPNVKERKSNRISHHTRCDAGTARLLTGPPARAGLQSILTLL